MTDPREMLDEIVQRVDRMATPDPTGMHTYASDERGRIAPDTYLTDADRQAGDYDPIGHIAADLLSLVAALQAVLDVTDGQHEYTCETSWIVGQVHQAITEALGCAQ